MRRYFLCFISLFVLAVLGASAQSVMLLSSKQGLSNSCIRNIYEDSRHNIWVTTQSGLNRFDGVKVNVYRHEVGDPNSLLHDESTFVLECDSNTMLIGTAAGLQVFDLMTDSFTSLPFINEGGDTIRPRVVSIARIEDGKRYVACMAGYGHCYLDRDEDGLWTLTPTADFQTEEGHSTPVQLFEDKEQKLWLINDRHVVYRKTAKGFKKYPEVPNALKLSMSVSKKLYVATVTDGIYVYNSEADRFDQVATGAEVGGVVCGFNPWTLGRMFISTDGKGVRVFNENTGQVTQSTLIVSDFDLASSNVKDAIGDSFGNVWIGVYWKGLVVKPVNQSPFEYIGRNSITKNAIGTNAVFALAPNGDGQVWVGTDNDGLYLMAADGSSSKHWDWKTNAGMPHAFSSIHCISPMNLLLGTYSDGLWQMKNGNISLVTRDIPHIFEVQPARDPGCYWIATLGNGFYHYNLSTGHFIQYTADWSRGEEGTKIIGNPYVTTLMQIDRRLYAGTADGLVICDVESGGVIKNASQKILSGMTIRHMALSEDGSTLWIGTNAGLVELDRKSLETQIYTTVDGIPNNNVVAVAIEDGTLWLSTDLGLAYMDKDTGHFNCFYSDDGLQDNEFSRGAVLVRKGRFYFGGIGGMTYFDTKVLEQWQEGSEHRSHLKLNEVYVGGKAVHYGDFSGSYMILQGLLEDCGRIDLCHTDNHFTLELCVEGISNQHIEYEYSVNDGPWMSQATNNSLIVFENLEPGTYHIRLRALTFGLISEEREFIAVIHPAWYESWWAKAIYAALFVLLCWLVLAIVRRQMLARRAEERHRHMEELNEAKIQFFMNISHEIRTPMTLIMAPLEKLLSTDKDEERQRNYKLIKQNSNRILRLINQTMDVRKIEQGKFSLDYHSVELVSFLQGIFDVFTSNAESRNIDYQFIHEGIDSYPVYVDGENMDKVVMNLLSNAFKFTPDGGKITLVLEGLQRRFTLKVMDSGVGISDEEKPIIFDRFYSTPHQKGNIGTGIGLNLASMLVKLHQGTIEVADNPEGQGTVFTVNMPKGDKSLCAFRPYAKKEKAARAEEAKVADEKSEKQPEEQTKEQVTEQTAESKQEEVDAETAPLLTIQKPTDTHRKNAVLVEDDESIRQYVHSELSSDLVIHSCSNGQEAWDYIISHPGKVDVVISDIMMPVMDGLTLCQKLKSNFNTNHVPIILMTALGSDADRIVGITNGADAYVSKPFNIDVLRTTVVQLMKSRQLLQGKFHGDKQQEEKIDKVELESPDEHLMKRVMKVINENMDNSELSVEVIADKVGISRVHFYRKMKDLTGQAPRDFVKYVRLKEAARLLSEKKLDITGVSIATGFKSLSAFSTNFKSLYGLSPTEWVKKMEQEQEKEE